MHVTGQQRSPGQVIKHQWGPQVHVVEIETALVNNALCYNIANIWDGSTRLI